MRTEIATKYNIGDICRVKLQEDGVITKIILISGNFGNAVYFDVFYVLDNNIAVPESSIISKVEEENED